MTFALSFQENSSAIMFGISAVFVLALLTSLMIKYARDGDSSTFVVLTALSLVASFGVSFYGFRSLYIAVSDKKRMEEKEGASIRSHYKMSRWSGIVSLIGIIGIVIAAIMIQKQIQ